MAVANKKSTIVTALDAAKDVPLRLSGAVLKSAVATVEVAAADDDNSVYRLFRVHSSWSPRHLWILNDAITSGTVYDLGLYDTAEAGGAVVTQEAFASDVTMASARVAPTDLLFEAADINKIEKRFWEFTSATADPNKWYDIAFTAATVGSGAGTLSMQLEYVEQV